MAVFQSKYRELAFYVNGERFSFSSGSYSTDDAEVIAVLETLPDVERADKAEQPVKAVQPEPSASKSEVTPRPTRKTSAK